MFGKRVFENVNPIDHVSTRYEFSFTLKDLLTTLHFYIKNSAV